MIRTVLLLKKDYFLVTILGSRGKDVGWTEMGQMKNISHILYGDSWDALSIFDAQIEANIRRIYFY